MARKNIEAEILHDMPAKVSIPSEWLEALEAGQYVVVLAAHRSAVYQRFRNAGISVKSSLREGKVFFWLND